MTALCEHEKSHPIAKPTEEKIGEPYRDEQAWDRVAHMQCEKCRMMFGRLLESWKEKVG